MSQHSISPHHHNRNLALVDWEGLRDGLKGRPAMFGIWLAKQSVGVCATQRNMALITGERDILCPNCRQLYREDSSHLNRCDAWTRDIHCYSRTAFKNLGCGWRLQDALTPTWPTGLKSFFSLGDDSPARCSEICLRQLPPSL